MFESILCQVAEYDPDVLESLIGLAVEIAGERGEGRRVGTLFTLGDENAVLARSRPLILDPLSGHPGSSLHVTNLNLRGTDDSDTKSATIPDREVSITEFTEQRA